METIDSIILKSKFVTSHQLLTHQSNTNNTKQRKTNKTVTTHLIDYDKQFYSDSLFPLFSIQTPDNFSNMLPQRKASFLAGRVAVNAAFQAIDNSPQVINSGIHKQPLWPENIKGSISHSQYCSIATVDQLNESSKYDIGIDIQHVISVQEVTSIHEVVLSKEELKYLSSDESGWSKNQLFTLIFSAKESFFKALYPSIKQYINFTDALISDIDFKNNVLIIKLHNNLEGKLKGKVDLNKEYKVSFDLLALEEQHVFSYCRF